MKMVILHAITGVNRPLGPIYTKRQRQGCDDAFAIPFSLKTMESLQNGVATYFQVTPLISMRTESLSVMAELSQR